MIKLCPPELAHSTSSPGEVSIYNKIRKFGQDYEWTVMHSYNVKNHIFKKWSDIDFLIIIPNKGVVCLEVKAHEEIRFQNRQWFFSAKRENKESPFDQIKRNQESLIREVKKIAPDLNVPWWPAVIFTSAKFSKGSLPPEINPWEFMDADSYASSDSAFFDFIESVIEKGRGVLQKNEKSAWVTVNDNNPHIYRKLAETLSGQGTFSISKKARNGDREISLSLATDEQFKILNLLANTPRLLVEGLAGTGKTLMAAKIAEREALKGKVLFLAYNKNLITELKNWPSLQSINITVESIDKFFKENVSGSHSINEDNYWDEILPLQFIDKIEINKLARSYDYLVIDEAQDILSKPYKIFALNKILREGLSEGRWSLFGDFDDQMIYGSESRDEIIGNLHKYCNDQRYILWSLTKNSRNPKRIGSFAQEYGRINNRYDEFLRPEDGVIEKKFYSKANRLDKIKKILETLENDGYEPDDIILLSKNKINRKGMQLINGLGFKIKDYRDVGDGHIKCCTISAFKGLESPVVVVLDIDNFTKDFEALFYIAITRSTDRLIMLLTEEASDSIDAID